MLIAPAPGVRLITRQVVISDVQREKDTSVILIFILVSRAVVSQTITSYLIKAQGSREVGK